MAGLKTHSKKKRDSSKPNTVLVIFLVFFILLSIGLGVWGYYGYAGQEKLEARAKQKEIAAQAEKNFADFVMYMRNESLTAIGAPGNPKDPIMDPADEVLFAGIRQEVLKENSKYKPEKYLEPFKKNMESFQADLGPFDEVGKKYPTTYRQLTVNYKDKLDKANTLLATTQQELKAANDKFLAYQTKQENYWKNAIAEIKKGNAASLKEALAKPEEFNTLLALNGKLSQENEDVKKQAADDAEGYNRKIKKLTEDVAKASNDKADGSALPANGGNLGMTPLHALVLDISRGKPLWDNPLGKIIRVDLQNRQVYINLGSANGVKPELTFNVFGTGWNGRADKELKGTIEVIRVLDANSALARITSLYDDEGKTIALGDPRRGRSQREADNVLKEGDLLYNMFWGARVAIAGNIQFAGQASDSPAEQMRIMTSFVHFLARQGITVDAYVDLNDGQVKGAISSRTRFLIRGDDLIDPALAAATPKKKEVKDDDAEPKSDVPAPMGEGAGNRIKAINETAAKMRQEAADKGLLVISTENFLNMIGYRQPRSAVYGDISAFRPGPIIAGQARPTPAVQAAPPKVDDDEAPAKKDAEKKDMDKKDKE